MQQPPSALKRVPRNSNSAWRNINRVSPLSALLSDVSSKPLAARWPVTCRAPFRDKALMIIKVNVAMHHSFPQQFHRHLLFVSVHLPITFTFVHNSFRGASHDVYVALCERCMHGSSHPLSRGPTLMSLCLLHSGISGKSVWHGRSSTFRREKSGTELMSSR